MSDLHSLEDKATLYVQGGLTGSERFEFEAQMAESVELRALVAELEEGAVALAMAVPWREPPKQVWQQIEKAVAEEAKGKLVIPSFWTGAIKNGWAAAAACLVGWLLYSLWVNQAGTPVLSPSQVAIEGSSDRETTALNSSETETEGTKPQPPAVANILRKAQMDLAAQTREIGELRRQIGEMENQAAHLSEILTQQQAQLSESGRFKFFQLAPASDGVSRANPTPPSPELQRALFLAMARELGWFRPANANGGNDQESEGSQPNSTLTNQTGVDFVNLHPATNKTTNPVKTQTQPEFASNDTSGQPSSASSSDSTIPVFVWDDRAYLAFSPSSVGAGSSVTIWDETAGEGFRSVGSTVMGNNIMVVTFSTANSDSLNFVVTTGTASGAANTFVPPPPPPPTSTPP